MNTFSIVAHLIEIQNMKYWWKGDMCVKMYTLILQDVENSNTDISIRDANTYVYEAQRSYQNNKIFNVCNTYILWSD